MSRKKIKKSPFTSLYDSLVGHYSFNLPLILKSITSVLDTDGIKMAITLLLCKA